jgi:hypothetical protein
LNNVCTGSLVSWSSKAITTARTTIRSMCLTKFYCGSPCLSLLISHVLYKIVPYLQALTDEGETARHHAEDYERMQKLIQSFFFTELCIMESWKSFTMKLNKAIGSNVELSLIPIDMRFCTYVLHGKCR